MLFWISTLWFSLWNISWWNWFRRHITLCFCLLICLWIHSTTVVHTVVKAWNVIWVVTHWDLVFTIHVWWLVSRLATLLTLWIDYLSDFTIWLVKWTRWSITSCVKSFNMLTIDRRVLSIFKLSWSSRLFLTHIHWTWILSRVSWIITPTGFSSAIFSWHIN